VAKQIIHKLVDDLDGGDAEETVKFALDGIQYEIDLSEKNATKLRELFEPYLTAGSKVARGGGKRPPPRRTPRRPEPPADSALSILDQGWTPNPGEVSGDR